MSRGEEEVPEDAGQDVVVLEGDAGDTAVCNGYLSLDGTTDSYVRISDTVKASLDIRAPLTVEARFKTETDEPLYVSRRCTEPVGGWALNVANTSASGTVFGKFEHKKETEIPGTGWRHLAWIFDGEESRLYLDGLLVDSFTTVADVASCNDPTYIGFLRPWLSTDTPLPQAGSIDELRISDIARYTENFIPTERHEPDASTLGLWHFDEDVSDSSGKYLSSIVGSGAFLQCD